MLRSPVRPIGRQWQLGDEASGVGRPIFSSSMVCLRQMEDSDEPEPTKNLPGTSPSVAGRIRFSQSDKYIYTHLVS